MTQKKQIWIRLDLKATRDMDARMQTAYLLSLLNSGKIPYITSAYLERIWTRRKRAKT